MTVIILQNSISANGFLEPFETLHFDASVISKCVHQEMISKLGSTFLWLIVFLNLKKKHFFSSETIYVTLNNSVPIKE